MVEEAQTLRSYIKTIVVKVPVTAEGLVATKELAELDILTLDTAVYRDGIGMVSGYNNYYHCIHPESKVFAASFRTLVRH